VTIEDVGVRIGLVRGLVVIGRVVGMVVRTMT